MTKSLQMSNRCDRSGDDILKRLIKAAIRRALPESLASGYDRYRQSRRARRDRAMTTEQVFTDVYANNRWGGAPGTFCSGSGSHESTIVSPYLAAMTRELGRIGAAALTAVDLGCGDYSVGGRLSPSCGRYVGVDIVKPLIAHNQAAFATQKVRFEHINIIEEELPHGDVCFVRQVLQHLSNEQISAVLPKLDRFRWCFISEHHPSNGRLRAANLDKPHGDSIRVSRGSGVFLDRPPFDIPRSRYRLLLEVPGAQAIDGVDPGIIRTYVLESPPTAS
jgi:hypothetical protein